MRPMPTAEPTGHLLFRPLSVAKRTPVNDSRTIARRYRELPANAARAREADRRLAGEEVRNPALEPLDRTEGMRPHRVQIEQAAELVFPERSIADQPFKSGRRGAFSTRATKAAKSCKHTGNLRCRFD